MTEIKGVDLCEAYFYSTFEESQDALAFKLKHDGDTTRGLAGTPCMYLFNARTTVGFFDGDPMGSGTKVPMATSMFAAEGSTQLMPAEVMVQSIEPRKNLYKNPVYFVLHWQRDGKTLATVRVDPVAGRHPIVRMHLIDGMMQMSTVPPAP
jgi:hypothetical protein